MNNESLLAIGGDLCIAALADKGIPTTYSGYLGAMDQGVIRIANHTMVVVWIGIDDRMRYMVRSNAHLEANRSGVFVVDLSDPDSLDKIIELCLLCVAAADKTAVVETI